MIRRFQADCPVCKHKFVLRTNHKLLGLVLTLEHWKFELLCHKTDHINQKTVELLGGIYQKTR